MMVRDTSSVILHALGIEQPVGCTGRVPGGLFPDCMETLPRPKEFTKEGHACIDSIHAVETAKNWVFVALYVDKKAKSGCFY